jgi:Tol biopolymer transport system component
MDPPSGLGDGDPAISPDGRDLVFSRMESTGRGDLWRLSVREDMTPLGKPERLTVDTPVNLHPAWMPDGSEIVYNGERVGPRTASLGYRSRKQPDPLPLAVTGHAPAISRQANRLAYEVRRQDSNIWRVEVPGLGAKPREGHEIHVFHSAGNRAKVFP